MRAFDYIQARTTDDALQNKTADNMFYAGGTDLLTLMKQDVVQVQELVDLKLSQLPKGIEANDGGLRIGALTTLTELEQSEELLQHYPVLQQAAALAATPQLRNRATLAGNLLQRPRCWYYRHRHVDCWLKGGTECPAQNGQNQQHAIFNSSPCHAVHTSDLAPALVALNASVNLISAAGERTTLLADLYAPPTDERREETRLEENELIASIDIPALPAASDSVYLKAMDRKVWAFALASVAAVRTKDSWRLVLGGVAAGPHRLTEVENALQGSELIEATIAAAAQQSTAQALALEHNQYKLRLVQVLVSRALQNLSTMERDK